MNIHPIESGEIRSPRKSEYKERLLKKRKSLAHSTESITTKTVLTSISQQAKPTVIIQDYDITLTDRITDFNPITGATGNLGDVANVFSLNAFFGVTFRTPPNGGITNDFMPSGMTISPEVPFFSFRKLSVDSLSGSQFIGLRLDNQGPENNETWFGWVELIMNGDNNNTNGNTILVRSTINNSGSPISAPEPSTGLLVNIAFAFSIFSRKRKRH